jgi:hypothetical protein
MDMTSLRWLKFANPAQKHHRGSSEEHLALLLSL